MRLFFVTARYVIPVIAVLWLARQSPLGERNGTLIVAILMSVCTIPQLIWLALRLAKNMLFLQSIHAFWVIYEVVLLLSLTAAVWVFLAVS